MRNIIVHALGRHLLFVRRVGGLLLSSVRSVVDAACREVCSGMFSRTLAWLSRMRARPRTTRPVVSDSPFALIRLICVR